VDNIREIIFTICMVYILESLLGTVRNLDKKQLA